MIYASLRHPGIVLALLDFSTLYVCGLCVFLSCSLLHLYSIVTTVCTPKAVPTPSSLASAPWLVHLYNQACYPFQFPFIAWIPWISWYRSSFPVVCPHPFPGVDPSYPQAWILPLLPGMSPYSAPWSGPFFPSLPFSSP